VDVEAIHIDIRYLGGYPPAFVLVHVELLQENDHLWRGDEGAGEVDATRGLRLGFIPGMVILSGELPVLVFRITWSQFQPASARGEKYAICPGIEAGCEPLFRDILSAGGSADIGVSAEMEFIESERESGRGDKRVSECDFLCCLLLRFGPRMNLSGFPRSSTRHGV